MAVELKNRRLSVIGAVFALDALLALFPPLHWWADGQRTVWLGFPVVAWYFLFVGLLICLSLAAAYYAEVRQGRFET